MVVGLIDDDNEDELEVVALDVVDEEVPVYSMHVQAELTLDGEEEHAGR